MVLRAIDPRRRFNCQHQDRESWQTRADEAVRLLAIHLTTAEQNCETPFQVGDFGCGNERLRPLLERTLELPFDYRGYDLHPQSANVERIDLNRELPPRVFDAVFCLGLLEYLDDAEDFVLRLHSACRFALLSYVILDGAGTVTPEERRDRGWVNDLTRAELEAIFASNGFTKRGFTMVDSGLTAIWLWAAR